MNPGGGVGGTPSPGSAHRLGAPVPVRTPPRFGIIGG
jgi:hypothetical protein